MLLYIGSCFFSFNTLPGTNIAGWKIHHFDGMKTRIHGDFHGRTVSFREGKFFAITGSTISTNRYMIKSTLKISR